MMKNYEKYMGEVVEALCSGSGACGVARTAFGNVFEPNDYDCGGPFENCDECCEAIKKWLDREYVFPWDDVDVGTKVRYRGMTVIFLAYYRGYIYMLAKETELGYTTLRTDDLSSVEIVEEE